MKRHAFPLAITATLASLVLVGCGEDEPTGADDPASTPAAETSDPVAPTTPASEEGPDITTTVTAPATTEVPVFFVADTPQGPRLFAEQREVEADNPLAEAVALLTAGDVADPDYRTLFPGGGFDSIEFDGDKFIVTVVDDGWNARGPGMTATEAELAVQQLVFTLQGVQGEQAPVVIEPTGSLFGIDASDGIAAAPELDVRGFVNVLSPAEGAAVSDAFTASGEASSFEATVPWQVRDDAGEMVLEGFATAEGWIDGLYPWATEVDVSDLAPGEYTFVAMTDDPSDGEGGGPTEDTKTIIVG